MFAAMSNLGGWVMGYFDGSQLRMWQWAKEYTLADNFFMAAFGGSYLNHHWLICACTPQHPESPDAMRVRLHPDGRLAKKPESGSAKELAVQVYSGGGGQVSPAYSVNTTQPPYQPSGVPRKREAAAILPIPRALRSGAHRCRRRPQRPSVIPYPPRA